MAAESTSSATGCIVHVRIEGRHARLDDAQSASLAVAEWLGGRDMSWLADGRAEYAAIANGETDGDQETTRYGRLIASAEAVATTAATKHGWRHDAIFVDIDAP